MKNLRKSLAIFLSLTFVIAVSQICFRSSDVNAANHGKYKDVAKIYDQGSCPSMQGMAVHGDYIYAARSMVPQKPRRWLRGSIKRQAILSI